MRHFQPSEASPATAPGETAETGGLRGRGADISVRGVSHAYGRAAAPVLSGIDLHVRPGEVVALIGRSGSGKSTLLRITAGLLRPSDGAVWIDGSRVEKPSPRWVMMFQAPSLFPWMSVAQNAGLGLRYAGRTGAAPARVAEVLALVDLSEFADRNVQDLSGGQQQRVALARSLATEPEALLLDEPFSALDTFTRRALQGDVRRIAKDLGLTLVLVTHDVAEGVAMADRAVLLSSGPGRIAADTGIALSEADRAEESAAFAAETARIERLYADIAGMAHAAPTPAHEGSHA